MRRWPVVAAVLCGLAGCGEERDPAGVYDDLEEAMLSAPGVELEYDIRASGAFQASLQGTLALAQGNRVRLEGAGTFGGDSVDVLLVSDGSRMELQVGSAVESFTTPPALQEAVVLGFTRMGLLHNLARLTGSAPPDHMEGGVRDWVQVSEFGWADGDTGGRDVVTFGLTVGGQPSGTAGLEIDPESGAPAARRQTVRFPEGSMSVVEHYGNVDLQATPTRARFAIPAR